MTRSCERIQAQLCWIEEEANDFDLARRKSGLGLESASGWSEVFKSSRSLGSGKSGEAEMSSSGEKTELNFDFFGEEENLRQGNIALKRVVKSIAKGDSHVPFRDSKLTILLQDSFANDKSNILMILCASSDPKEMYKTLCTLEYGAKAKCIVRGSHIPNKDKNGGDESSSAVILGTRI
ncbi:Uncharacterized protein Rs2_13252 [Raphanus sativus]|nr:Uncharacterized protein Rs2_13252 [Raphanus sativus]